MAVVRKGLEPPLVQVLDTEGRVIDRKRDPDIAVEDLRRMYRLFLLMRHMDERMLRLQRQGRLGFYMTSTGEEACQVGAAWALRPEDWVFPSYREPGVALWRGYALFDFVCQLMGNAGDPIKGRQMPVHHSVRSLHFVSISSPVGTQVPQAVGAAYAARLRRDPAAAIAFFGEGTAQTSEVHCAMNFAGVWKAPVVFFCRNNGWAISVPAARQTAAETIAQRGAAYGFPGVLVDGNDVLAVAAVTRDAIDTARAGGGPTLIEGRTYRRGAHSTSDDPNVYRDPDEPRAWEKRDPVERFRKFLAARRIWTEAWQKDLAEEVKREVGDALAGAEAKEKKPPVETLFDDVYAEMPRHLAEQRAELCDYLARRGPVGGGR